VAFPNTSLAPSSTELIPLLTLPAVFARLWLRQLCCCTGSYVALPPVASRWEPMADWARPVPPRERVRRRSILEMRSFVLATCARKSGMAEASMLLVLRISDTVWSNRLDVSGSERSLQRGRMPLVQRTANFLAAVSSFTTSSRVRLNGLRSRSNLSVLLPSPA